MNARRLSSAAVAQEALTRATTSQALSNLPTIYREFLDRGLPESEIKPRENIFTYHAWRALGRQVKRGEHGVRVVTYIVKPGQVDPQNPEARTAGYKFPRSVTVFHVSQTEPVAAGAGA